jgi:hypothetical protein
VLILNYDLLGIKNNQINVINGNIFTKLGTILGHSNSLSLQTNAEKAF